MRALIGTITLSVASVGPMHTHYFYSPRDIRAARAECYRVIIAMLRRMTVDISLFSRRVDVIDFAKYGNALR